MILTQPNQQDAELILKMYQEQLTVLIKQDTYRMAALRAARELQLPDWYAAAGFIRNLVWDELHGFSGRTPLADVDIIYFNPHNITKQIEKQYEDKLQHIAPEYPWSVKNQARMHLQASAQPYSSVEDAMSRWPETATAVGVRLEADDRFTFIAPYGLTDLFGLILRQSPMCGDRVIFDERVKGKRWMQIWTKLVL